MEISCSIFVNSAGLVMDIFGAILLWKYGLPDVINRDGLEVITVSQVNEAEVAKAKTYDRWSQLGLTLLIVGFIFQLISNFI